MVLTFDTQQIYRSLASEGNFSDSQAETLTNALKEVASLNIEHLASKQDLEQLEERIDHRFREVEQRFREMEQRLTIKLGGMMVVGLGVIVALQQLLGG